MLHMAWKCNILVAVLAATLHVLPGQEVMHNLQVKTFVVGQRNENDIWHAKWFYGKNACEMITVVRIIHSKVAYNRYVKCIGFTYGDQENNCPSSMSGSTVSDFVLEKDEFVNYASADSSYFNLQQIESIYFRTNKNRSIGPFGQRSDYENFEHQFSYNGAPLLSVRGLASYYVYTLYLTFYSKSVLDLGDKTKDVAGQTYDAISGSIMDIFQVHEDNYCMLPDLAKQGCYYLGTQETQGAQMACDLKVVLEQVNLLTSASAALQNHAPRNLLTLKDYDSSAYLDEVKEARDFHSLLTDIQFGLNTVISVTQQQSADLSAFFKTTADFDKKIAEQDQIYIQGKLKTSQEGAAESSALVGNKLGQILGVGVSLAATSVVDQAFHLGTVIAANLNPFKLLFSGPDVDALMEAVEELMSAVRDLLKLTALLGRLQEFTGYLSDLAENFAANKKQLDAMEQMVEVLTQETDAELIQEYATDFIDSYGAYTPQVTSQQIVYVTTLLDAMAGEACSIISDLSGLLNDLAGGIYESVTMDCVYITADIAVLTSYYEEVYTLQFELVTAMTSIVKGHIAVSMADKIGSIKTSIDIETAAIGSAIVETKYQTASLARCDILEYISAGKRPTICQTLLFQEDEIQKLIAYTGSPSSSERTVFAFLPTLPQEDIEIPYINITELVKGQYQNIKLPMANKAWLKNFGWLPSSYDPETAFYVDAIEMYLPGLKCYQSGQAIHAVHIESLSSNPTSLYSEEAPPRYTVDQYLVKFEYTEPAQFCAGDTILFPVRGHNSQVLAEKNVCVVSNGLVNADPKEDFTHPSLFTVWTIKVTGHSGCTLVEDRNMFLSQPMITLKMQITEVFVKKSPNEPGIDECWPPGSRCPPGDQCHNEELSYYCE